MMFVSLISSHFTPLEKTEGNWSKIMKMSTGEIEQGSNKAIKRRTSSF